MSTGTTRARTATTNTDRAVLDVSEVAADRVRQYARESSAVGHTDVYLERKGGRTFLVAD